MNPVWWTHASVGRTCYQRWALRPVSMGAFNVSLMGRWRRVAARAFRGPGARAVVGVLEWLADSPRGTFAVLTYHRVDDEGARAWLYPPLLSATPRGFEEQMAALARHHRPITLAELLAANRGEGRLPSRAVLVTFDDAYRDFRDNAWPILTRLGIPATLFVPTAYPDAPERAFWWDRVWQAVTAAPRHRALRSPVGALHLRTEDDRRVAARALVEHYKSLPHAVALREVDALCTNAPPPPTTSDVLGWAELRTLHGEGLNVAPHSRTHPLLTRLSGGEAQSEIDGSRRDLTREVGEQTFTGVFAYPAGAHDAATRRVVSDLGIELAFTTERGINRLGEADPLALRRINVGLRSRSEAIRGQIAVARMRHGVRRS